MLIDVGDEMRQLETVHGVHEEGSIVHAAVHVRVPPG